MQFDNGLRCERSKQHWWLVVRVGPVYDHFQLERFIALLVSILCSFDVEILIDI